MSLLFTISELQQETQAFREFSQRYLAPGSDQVLRQTEQNLLTIARRTGGPFSWEIHQDNPLLSQLSYGNYMPDDKGKLCVHAEMTFKWHLEPVRKSGDTRPALQVRLNGLASTAIRIMEGDPNDGNCAELAVWRMEIADDAAPGSYFHVQVLGREQDTIFPKDLDVPRLPSVLASPLACMEFAIGELFQESWPKHASKETGASRRWRSVQAFRHTRQLQWHLDQVASGSGSPWVAWKRAKPEDNLFLR